MQILAPEMYKSPREGTLTAREARIRECAYELKNSCPAQWALDMAAPAMALALDKVAVSDDWAISLVPIPSSKGITSANITLCEAIKTQFLAWRPNAKVEIEDVLTRTPSEEEQHTSAKRKTAKEIKTTRTRLPKTEYSRVVLVDNVAASLATARSAKNALRGIKTDGLLVFADARSSLKALALKKRVAEVRTVSLLPARAARRCDCPSAISQYFREVIKESPSFDPEKEQMVTILLNKHWEALGFEIICKGSKNEAHFKVIDVLRPVIASGALQFVLLHNHPSGDPSPSQADLKTTQKIRDAANVLETDLMDHVIVGEAEQYFSFRDSGHV